MRLNIGRKGERTKMPSREVRTGNMNSVHDDVLSDIFNENTKFIAKPHTIQYWST